MISKKKTAIRMDKRFEGIYRATVINTEKDLYRAYLDFAMYHAQKTVAIYESAVPCCDLTAQRLLFTQLAILKREVIDRLIMNGATVPVLHTPERNRGVAYYRDVLAGVDASKIKTLQDALDFAYKKETKALTLFETLTETVNLFSINMLFDYLIESQRGHILFLDTQMTVAS